ncbi:MAG: tetratricopeptide repeat protein [Flavobacteriaceae bacterium]
MTVVRLLFFSLYVAICFSQTNQSELDSIVTNIKTATSDSIRIQEEMRLAKLYFKNDLNKAQVAFLNALETVKSSGHSSTYWYDQECYIYDSLGVIARKHSNYEEALTYYLQALKIKEQLKDSTNLGRSYHNLAMLFKVQRKFSKSRHYMLKALPLRKKFNDSVQYGKSLSSYGAILNNLKNTDSAKWYFNEAKRYLKGSIKIADVNSNLARLLRKEKRYKEAVKIYKENLALYEKEGLQERIVRTKLRLARSYRFLANYELCLKELEEVKPLAAELNNTKWLAILNFEYFNLYKLKTDFENALHYYITFKTYQDTTYNVKRDKTIKSLELNYKYAKKHLADSLQFVKEKEQLELINTAQKSKNKLYNILFFLGLMVIVTLILLIRHHKKLNVSILNKKQLEKELLHNKLEHLSFKVDQLTTDNKMRLQFKKEFLTKIKDLKANSESYNFMKYKTLIIELQNQINTEQRLDGVSKSLISGDADFEQKLHSSYPTLTKSEREICNLIRINMSAKEIMNVRNTSLDSIKSARYRIRKKMNIPKGIELELFVQNL